MKALKTFFTCLVMIASLLIVNSLHIFADGETELSAFNTLNSENANILKISSDGTMILATGNSDNTYLWNINSGISKKINITDNWGATRVVFDAAFSPDGTLFALTTGILSQKIWFFDSKSGELKNTILLKSNDAQDARFISFTADSKAIIAEVRYGQSSTIRIINIVSNEERLKFDVPDRASKITHNPKNDEFAVFLSEYQSVPYDSNNLVDGIKRSLLIRDEKTGTIIKSFSSFASDFKTSKDFSDMAYSQDGSYLVASHSDGTHFETIVLDAKNNYEQIKVLDVSGSISFSKDSKSMVVGSKVFPVDEHFTQSYDIKAKGSSDKVNPTNATLTPDGKYLVYANDGVIKILDAATLSIRLISIEIEPKKIEMGVNENMTLKLSGVYSDGTKKSLDSNKVKWSIQDFYVAEMKNSTINGRSNGQTILTANYGSLTTSSPVTVVDTPTNLEASINGKNVKLAWSAVKNTNDLIGYNMYRSTSSGGYDKTPLTDFPITATDYTDANIVNDQEYYYIIKAVYTGQIESPPSVEVFVSSKSKQIILQVDNPYMTVNGERKEVDAGIGTKPIVFSGKTLLPIRSLIEELGGKLEWFGKEQKITLQLNDSKIDLWIDKNKAIVNGIEKTLDVAPKIIKERTMLPLRFITDNLGLILDWEPITKTITLSYGGNITASGDRPAAMWYEQEYTQPVSNIFGKYIDSGIGFSMNYPLVWGRPVVAISDKYSYHTITTFYKSDNNQFISFGDSLQPNESYESYVTRSGYTKADIVLEGGMLNADKVYYINTESNNIKKVVIMVFKQSEVCVIENKINNVNLSQADTDAIDIMVEILQTFEISGAVG